MSAKFRFSMLAGLLTLLALSSVSGVIAQEKRVLNIYSARHYGAIEEAFTQFEADTGIEIRLSQGEPRALLERLRAEGDRSPADIFLAIDAGVISLAAEEELLQVVDSDILLENIDESQRDPDNRWFALSQRLRTLVYNPSNVTEAELAALNDYADLADPSWQGRVCQRPASHIYTVSLTSSLLYHLGEEEARSVIEGIVANQPRYINSDTSIINAVAAGECDVAFVNHYYLARLIDQEDPVASQVALKWMNQESSGVFYNVNVAGVTANAENYDEAVEFLEYFSTLEGQSSELSGFPGSNYEYPSNFAAELHPILETWGEVTLDLDYPLWEYGTYQADAITLLEEAGFGFEEN